MANIIWNRFNKEEQNEYIEFLKIFGALSGLFKDNQEGSNAKKPYLYYRNHEQLFVRVFSVEDLTRKDSAFDALAKFNDMRVGIGLKTWIHTKDKTYQKVAEFNKLAPTIINPLIQSKKSYEVIKAVSNLRNERILLDKRLHNTDKEVYHYITRDDNSMNIVESNYELIDIDSLELIKEDGKTYTFKDKFNNYKFYTSKSVLLKEFNAEDIQIISKIDIEQFDDPFELIKMIELPKKLEKSNIKEEIYLPLYQDKKEGKVVSERSGINMRHSSSKVKGKNIPRPEYEIEVRVSKWIHHLFPNFFGIDALNEDDIKNTKLNDFDLVLPDDRVLRGRIKQQGGKSLQTNPQGDLGKWILKDVLGLENREVVTMQYLETLGIDSLKITKENEKTFRVTVAPIGSYEEFKNNNKEKMIDIGLKGVQLPYFRDLN